MSSQNVGHGHVFPRPDGVKARCGGPAICHVCAIEHARKSIAERVAAQPAADTIAKPQGSLASNLVARLREARAAIDRAGITQFDNTLNGGSLYLKAAEEIERQAQVIADKEDDCVRLHKAFMDLKYPETVSPETTREWRCFHCDEAFTDREKAAEHFGKYEMLQPACTIDVTEYRRMEEVNGRHCAEDTELHREMHRMSADHAVALRREEEKGYARGLRDAGFSEKTNGEST